MNRFGTPCYIFERIYLDLYSVKNYDPFQASNLAYSHI